MTRSKLLATLFMALGLALLVPGHATLAGETHSGGTSSGPAYIRMAPMTITVIGPNDKIDRHVSIQIDLELEPGKTESMFEAYRRNMLDAFLVALKGLYDDDYPGQPVPTSELKARLLNAANDVAGDIMVHQVLLISIGERRAR